jgi:hypothetical protein
VLRAEGAMTTEVLRQAEGFTLVTQGLWTSAGPEPSIDVIINFTTNSSGERLLAAGGLGPAGLYGVPSVPCRTPEGSVV